MPYHKPNTRSVLRRPSQVRPACHVFLDSLFQTYLTWSHTVHGRLLDFESQRCGLFSLTGACSIFTFIGFPNAQMPSTSQRHAPFPFAKLGLDAVETPMGAAVALIRTGPALRTEDTPRGSSPMVVRRGAEPLVIGAAPRGLSTLPRHWFSRSE
jgi:hypothetical protein